MPYDREQWEEVSFQVLEDMGGAIRSGYFPTGEGLVSGNILVDHAFGNFPIQPNDDRTGGMGTQLLGVLDSHKIAAVEWNSYPAPDGPTFGSRNYMVTAAEYLGGNVYEYTSQNDLKVGDRVVVSNAGDYSFPPALEVIYADKLKFQVDAELGLLEKVTGLAYARVDVIDEPWNGHTLSGEGNLFIAPRVGLWSGSTLEEAKIENYFDYLREIGVNPGILKDMTFSGGEDEWDHAEGSSNDDGIVLYTFIPAYVELYKTEEGVPVYGSDVEGCILYSLGFGPNDEVYAGSNNVEDFMVTVVSNDPRKNNESWW